MIQFLLYLLIVICVKGDFTYNEGCSLVSRNIKTSLDSINGTWYVVAKSKSIPFEYGCKDLKYTFSLEELEYKVEMECYNLFLKKKIVGYGRMWPNEIDSQFSISYVKDIINGWNRHYSKPFDIIYVDKNLMISVECHLGYDQHLVNQDSIPIDCRVLKKEEGCSFRSIWFEWCNIDCPNKQIANNPIINNPYTGIRIMKRDKYTPNLSEIQKLLKTYGFEIKDLNQSF